MNRNYFVIIAGIALLCLLLIFVSLWQEIDTPVTKDPVTQLVTSPYKSQIAGIGIVEPSSENIYIGAPLNRSIGQVFVKVGEKVEKGEALFSLENKDLQANLNLQKAAYESALARLEKLKLYPRQEDIAIAEANLNHAKVALEQAKTQNDMIAQLSDQRAISQEERNRRLFAYRQAESQWNEAQSNYAKVKLGSWKPDLEIAGFEVAQAKANVDMVNAELERTVIRSPIDATVLQIKIHDGEFPTVDSFKAPLMVIGNVDNLYVRVSINQLDIPYFNPESPAVAYAQGDKKLKFPLSFVRVEPLLVPKQNVNNEISEKVDTRVLQIIYRIKNTDNKLYVGQQMDVFIETQRAQEK